MGTKNNPGNFDCYENAKPDEPMFILLARDPLAPAVVEYWAELRRGAGRNVTRREKEKHEEALQCAHSMKVWRQDMAEEPVV